MTGEIVFYQSDDGTIRLETRLENGTLWLTPQKMAELFQTSAPNISMHVKNVFDEGKLQAQATVQDFLTVRKRVTRQRPLRQTDETTDKTTQFWLRAKAQAIIDSHSTKLSSGFRRDGLLYAQLAKYDSRAAGYQGERELGADYT